MKRALLLLGIAFGIAACRKSAPAVDPPSTDAFTAPSAAPMPNPGRSGPAPSPEPGREARERATFALLSGEHPTEALPEVATPPGEGLDPTLRDQLAPAQSAASRPRGQATIGDARAPATIANAARVTAGMRAGFRACYSLALQESPKAMGVVNLSLAVDAQGAVNSVTATPATLTYDALNCIKARAKAAQFDPPSDGKPATVAFSVTFTPE